MADFHYSYEVCNCKKVTLGEVIHAVKEQGADTIETIGDITDAGIACGCCRSSEEDFSDPKMKLYLTQILDKFSDEK
jgi:bacterioferritin-associated ferredoxin